VLTVEETQRLLSALSIKERTMVLMAVGTGLRRSELFALKWKDVDFAAKHLSVTRSIVSQVVGICKTEASQKPVPLHESLAQALLEWHKQSSYRKREDWVFASPHSNGKRPYWAQVITWGSGRRRKESDNHGVSHFGALTPKGSSLAPVRRMGSA
jgi:integrase